MKQITIGFSRACTTFPIFSWAIMAAQRTPYSHVYLKYQDEYLGQIMYYQASHTLVNSMSESVFLSQETPIYEFTFNVSDESFLACMKFAANQSGKPYGVLEICGLAFVEIGSFVGIKITNPFKDAGQTWICSELIAELLNQCENINLPTDLNDMTPKEMYELVNTLPKTLS